MNLSGTLADWSVADLLSMIKVTGKTATLYIKGRREGSIDFADGRVVSAAITGEAPAAGEPGSRTAAADALFVLSGLTEGSFEIGPMVGTPGEGWEVDGLLTDLERLKGLEDDLADAGLRGVSLVLRNEVDDAVTVQTEDWWALASLVSVLSFDQLEAVFGSGRAIRLLHTLWRMDLVQPAPVGAVAEPVGVPAPVETEPAETEPETSPEIGIGPDAAPDAAPESAPEPVVDDDEAWLDEIAASADEGDVVPATTEERRRLMGVAAPASTVLTGSVLDEMRRLRSHSGE